MKISKSKRQLAQLLVEAGVKQFPDGAEWAAQDSIYAGLFFYTKKPVREKGDYIYSREHLVAGSGRIVLSESIPNWHQTALSRAEFDQIVAEGAEQSKPDADGWIEWNGGLCPVDGNDLVTIRTRGWRRGAVGKASDLSWEHRGDGGDIVAYRLHKPEQADPQYCESVTRSIPEPVTAPTLDQLLQDYRNAADFAAAKQAEADEAAKMRDERWQAVQALACDLGVRIIAGLAVDAEMRKSEPVITDWRDLRVGDVIVFSGDSVELKTGEYVVSGIMGADYPGKRSIQVSAEVGVRWIGNDEWRFIRRP